MIVSVYRSGEFAVPLRVENDQKCGSYGKRTFRYEVEIAISELYLNQRDFVLDNADIDRYFQKAYSGESLPFISCERMCLNAVWELVHIMDVPIDRIRVRVWGSDVSYAETIRTNCGG